MNKNFFLKVSIVVIIIIVPIVILLQYSKKHTFVEVNQTLPQEYTKYFHDKYTLLYIGYSGCVNICTPRLQEISTLQRVLNDKGTHIGYMFLDLRTLGDDLSHDFLKAFDGNFEVLSLEETKKNEFFRLLGFYFSQSLYDTNEFEHSSYLYLIKNEGNSLKVVAIIMQYPFLNEHTINFLDTKVNNEKPKN